MTRLISDTNAKLRDQSDGPRFTIIKISAIAAEVMLIALVTLYRLDLMLALLAHAGLGLGLLILVLFIERRGRAAGDLQKFSLLTIVAGPLGGAAAMISEQLSSHVRTKQLSDWYDTIAPPPQPVVTLADRIRDDQVVRPTAKLPQSVHRLLSHGTMREKQALFASVIADGRPEGLELIETALWSDDQRVRVQAAAVSAFIRARARTNQGTPASHLKLDTSRFKLARQSLDRSVPVTLRARPVPPASVPSQLH